MRNISIKIPDGFGGVLASQIEQAVQASVSSTLMATKSRWEQEVQQRLRTTQLDYLLGLNADNSLEFPDPYTGILTLRGKWPNMLETGFPSFDMKDGLKNGPRAKKKKDGGWYNTVPYRHTNPKSVGAVVGRNMPNDIYAQARALRGGQKLTGTETNYPPQTSWTGYQHKSGIYEGMIKNRKQYDKAVQSTYFTFRRVSDKSDPMSWKHPGFSGVKAMDVVEPYARKTFNQVFSKYIKDAMG